MNTRTKEHPAQPALTNIGLMTIMTYMTRKLISLAEAKAKLSELVVRAAYAGEEFVITRRNRPAALLAPVPAQPEGSDLADAQGWLHATDPFFNHLEEPRRASRSKGPRVLDNDRRVLARHQRSKRAS